VKEHPVTPKFGLTYQANDRNMFYATAAKGYRQGGVNTTAQTPGCTAALAAYGGNPPDTYNSDKIWSYEVGSKMRMFSDTVQVNSSVFLIDWKDIQTNVPLPGCFTFVLNAAQAQSKGFDIQTQARVTDALLLNMTVGYTDAAYTGNLFGPVSTINGTRSFLIRDGDMLPVSPWTVSAGGQYDTQVGTVPMYVRADYEFNSAYRRTFGPGTTTYGPDVYEGNSTEVVSARAGVNIKGVDLSLFVNNLFNSQDPLDRQGGRSNCATAECTSYTFNSRMLIDYTFRPRTFGITASYRY
jgi:outer membrane receptor protein involved in Fe transport